MAKKKTKKIIRKVSRRKTIDEVPERLPRVSAFKNYKVYLQPPGVYRTAKYFRITYKGKEILEKTLFPSHIRKEHDRQDFVTDYLISIEETRKKISTRKKRMLKWRLDAEARQAKRKRRSLLKRVAEGTLKDEFRKGMPKEHAVEIVQRQLEQSEQQILDFENAELEQPQVLPYATIESVLVIPFVPVSVAFHKELIEKTIVNIRNDERLPLSILNYSLNESDYIPISHTSFEKNAVFAYYTFLPHVLEFFDGIKQIDADFILRIKYRRLLSIDSDGRKHFDSPQGISEKRSEMFEKREISRMLLNTLQMFAMSPRKQKENYLSGDTILYLTGFTLEATTPEPL